MARVLICEPHDDISALLELVVRRLGHEPVVCVDEDVEGIAVEAAVIEPGEPSGLHVARQLRGRGVPVLFTSIYPADHATLALEPAAYLVKPFPLYLLERALQDALEQQPSAPRCSLPSMAEVASDLMLREPKTLAGDASVAEVRSLLANPKVQLVLLADGTQFVGAITRFPGCGGRRARGHVRGSGARDDRPGRARERRLRTSGCEPAAARDRPRRGGQPARSALPRQDTDAVLPDLVALVV